MVVVVTGGPTFLDDPGDAIIDHGCVAGCPWYTRIFGGDREQIFDVDSNGRPLILCRCSWGILDGILGLIF